jgi:nucleotide-binding universal stress UspA family protein
MRDVLMSMFKKILVPLDHSALADSVLDAAVSLASTENSEIIALRVADQPVSLDPAAAATDLNVIEQESAELIKRIVDRGMPGLKVTAEVRTGGLVDAIVEASKDLMVDVIVMGTHGRQGITEHITGSTTEQVVAKSTTSVLIVRPAGYPYLRD